MAKMLEIDVFDKILNHSGAVAVVVMGLLALRMLVPLFKSHVETLRDLTISLVNEQRAIRDGVDLLGGKVDRQGLSTSQKLELIEQKLLIIEGTVNSIYGKAKSVCRKIDADRRDSDGY